MIMATRSCSQPPVFDALANVGSAAVLLRWGVHVYTAALAGILIGSVWNYALSSRFVWGRF